MTSSVVTDTVVMGNWILDGGAGLGAWLESCRVDDFVLVAAA